ASMAHWEISKEDGALVLTRDDWSIRVLFDGPAPATAEIRKPGSSEWQHLNRRDITTHVRGHRHQMTMFRLGDRVKVGDRYGTVTDMCVATPTALTSRACPVRLDVLYVDGHSGTPYATSALRLREALA